MKKIYTVFLLALFALVVFIVSCKKDSAGSNDTDTGNMNDVSSHHPAELSAAIKIFHGQRIAGALPGSTGNIPSVTGPSTIKAFAGRYAIIKPELASGEIEGYYVAIPASGQYFNVEFTKARNIPGRKRPNYHHRTSLRPLDGNADSSIVIELPSNIKIPDTICVTYVPYNQVGNIGQPVTTCIIVEKAGGDANSDWLLNVWKETASWDIVDNQRKYFDTILYNQWRPLEGYDETYAGYECVTDPDSSASHLDHAPRGSLSVIVQDSVYTKKGNVRYSSNGAFDTDNDEDDKYVDYWSSTCTAIVFFPLQNYKPISTGAWTYNSETKKMTILFEFDIDGYPNPEAWEYEVIARSDNEFILHEPINNSYFRFER